MAPSETTDSSKPKAPKRQRKDKAHPKKQKQGEAKPASSAKPAVKEKKTPAGKAVIAAKLEPHEQENLQTIAQLLTGSASEPVAPEAGNKAGKPDEFAAGDASLDEIHTAQGEALPAIEILEKQNALLNRNLHDARVLAAELQTILDTATDGVIILDDKGSILNMNRPAEALFGQGLERLQGTSLIDLLAPESQQLARNYLQRFNQSGFARLMNDGCEVTAFERGGGTLPLFMTLGSLGGQIPGRKFCAVLRDITQWKKAEADLTNAKRRAEEASDQKTDFLAKISHEIRTPLNAIIGFAEVMLEERLGPVGSERYKEYLQDIRTSGGHLLSLVNELLDLSKVESGELDLTFSPVYVNDLVLQSISLMQPQANRSGIIVRSSLQKTLPVAADPRSLRQILLNLLSNAIRFTKPGGQVIVSTVTDEDGSVVLRVRDTGIGMNEMEIAQAMEPFRQIRSGQGGDKEGTGLGLPITKALVEANRAQFKLESMPNMGTLAIITFPSTRTLED